MIHTPCAQMCTAIFFALSPILPLQTGPTGLSFPPAGPRVIFYSPATAERDSIVRLEGTGIAQLLDDFDYYSGRASSFLRQNRIRAEFTSELLIPVRGREGRIGGVTRAQLEDIFGAILTDGVQEPRVLPGVLTDEELIVEVRSYYRLK